MKSPRSGILGHKPAFTQTGAILSQTNHGVHMSPWASIKPRYQIGNPFFSLVQVLGGLVDPLRNPVLIRYSIQSLDIKSVICEKYLQHQLLLNIITGNKT